MHRARGARPCGFDSLPSKVLQEGTLPVWPSKANRALLHDEVRILIFDDPAEQEDWQCPVVVRSDRGPVEPARARRAGALHGENL